MNPDEFIQRNADLMVASERNVGIHRKRSDDYIEIPHKNDLDLGKYLVFKFVERYIPEKEDEVYSYFQRSGDYSKYKYFLERDNLLDRWYELEDQRTKSVLLEWCHENGIEVE